MIKKYLKIYQRAIKNSLMTFLVHRFNLAMSGVANIIWTVAQLISLRYLFLKIPAIQGWNFGDLVLLLSFGQAYFYLSWIFYDMNLQQLPIKIIRGDLDKMLLKPVNVKFLASFEKIAIPQILVMISTVTPLFIYGLRLQTSLTITDCFFALIVLGLGIINFYFISLGITALAFFIGDVESIRFFVLHTPTNLNRVPLNIFPQLLQYALTFILPIAFLAFYPTMVIKGRLSPFTLLNIELGLIYLSYLFSRWMWKIGLKNYTSASK